MDNPIQDAKEQICLISQQPLPNYMGAVALTHSVKTVHFIVTPKMEEAARRLQSVLEHKNIKVFLHKLNQPRQKELFDLLENIRKEADTDVIINVTGGTKIMSLTAVEWANMNGITPFYVDTEAEELLYLGISKTDACPITTRLKVKDILEAQGFFIDPKKLSRKDSISNREVLKEIVRFCIDKPNILSSVNYTIAMGDKSKYCCIFKKQSDLELYRLFEKAGMAKINQNKVQFKNDDAMKWCNGGWLESYVHSALHKLLADKKIDDWTVAIEFFSNKEDVDKNSNDYHKRKGINNEFDATFTVNNRLFVIECKTVTFEGTQNAQRGTEIAYKLDSLTNRAGGVFASGILISINNVKDTVKMRMKEAQRKVICGRELLNLEKALEDLVHRK